MANINLYFRDYIDVEITAEEWFREASDNEIKEMQKLCEKHINNKSNAPVTMIEEEFFNKIEALKKSYMSLTMKEIETILKIKTIK